MSELANPQQQIDQRFAVDLDNALKGHPQGFEAIWHSYAKQVAGYVRIRGVEDVDATTNEIFLGVFRNLASFEGNEQAFRSWLFTIAFRRVVDEQRSRSRRVKSVPMDSEVIGPASSSAEDVALRQAGTQRIRALCETLSSEQRDVLMLRMVSGLSLDEVAEVMGKSTGAIKALQHRAVSTLAKTLKNEGVSR